MMECLDNPVGHHSAIFDKYLNKRFKGASHFAHEEVTRGFRPMDPERNVQLTWKNLCTSSHVYEYILRGVNGYATSLGRVC
jgi:hypothetical protein